MAHCSEAVENLSTSPQIYSASVSSQAPATIPLTSLATPAAIPLGSLQSQVNSTPYNTFQPQITSFLHQFEQFANNKSVSKMSLKKIGCWQIKCCGWPNANDLLLIYIVWMRLMITATATFICSTSTIVLSTAYSVTANAATDYRTASNRTCYSQRAGQQRYHVSAKFECHTGHWKWFRHITTHKWFGEQQLWFCSTAGRYTKFTCASGCASQKVGILWCNGCIT